MDIIGILALIVSLISALIAFSAYLRIKFQAEWSIWDEYDQLAEKMAIFWDCLRQCYQKFKRMEKNEITMDTLRDFINSAGMPPSILDCHNIKNYQLSSEYKEKEVMMEFCERIYPYSASNQKELVTISIVANECSDFFLIHSKLTSFWDKWCRRIALRSLAKNFQQSEMLLIMLTWLDIAHRKWTRENDPGRKRMYKLAIMIRKNLNS